MNQSFVYSTVQKVSEQLLNKQERKNNMYGLKKLILEEERRLQAIKVVAEQHLEVAPEGTLRIASSKRQKQYMYCTDECEVSRTRGRYIRKGELYLAEALAQKAYYIKVQKLAEKRLRQLAKLSKDYEDDEIERIYVHEHEERKGMIVPVEETWQQKLDKWLKIPYERKDFAQGTLEIYTKNGERVRSKSEKILADTFFDMGIPYKYECPLFLKEYGTIYPDFTFLSSRTGEEIYWEHDGRMDDPHYAEKAVKKIDSYIKNGIFPGERLIVSYETSGYIMNQKVINALIEKNLL